MLMARAAIKGLPGNRRPRPRHETPTASDLVERMFTREAPNRLWVTDITEHRTYEGKVYCAVVLDTFSRRVVGWSIDSSQTAALVTNALSMAIANRDPGSGGIIHSDHGVQFTSWAFTDRAKRSGLVPSMGSIGDCYDNAMIESFWGRMQTELLNRKRWKTRDRIGQRDLRLSGDLPQPPTAPFRTRDAHSDRVRTATPNRPTRGLNPSMATPPNPGHIRASGNAGVVHSPGRFGGLLIIY